MRRLAWLLLPLAAVASCTSGPTGTQVSRAVIAHVRGSVKAVGPHWVKIDTVSHDFHPRDNACTGDLGPATTTIQLASTVDDMTTLKIDLDGRIVRLVPRTH